MPLAKFFVVPFCFCIAAQLQAAEWRACEKAKLRQLNLERSAHADNGGGRAKKHSRGSAANKTRQNADQLDEWLWKNCRDYANELRSLEQQQM